MFMWRFVSLCNQALFTLAVCSSEHLCPLKKILETKVLIHVQVNPDVCQYNVNMHIFQQIQKHKHKEMIHTTCSSSKKAEIKKSL